MSTEPQRTCPSCGNEFSGAMEFCPVCMLRAALPGAAESGASSFEGAIKPTPEQSAQRYEHYELVTGEDGKPVELGRGAMGVTYKAVDVNLRCPVTLKVISERYLGDESARLRFLREARAAASVRHPNVASVFHLGRTGDNYFYAMEFVEGETLQDLIKRSGRLDVELAREIVTQVAAGLAAVHEQNLVHRDIKPTNIMVRLKEEGGVTAKIIDLGLAKTLDESASEAGISSPGAFVGTPEFASPEQFVGVGVDIRSDLYSLGVTLVPTPFRILCNAVRNLQLVRMTPEQYSDVRQVYKYAMARDAFTEISRVCEHLMAAGISSISPEYYAMAVGIVTMYGRPFTNNARIGTISTSLVPTEFEALHAKLMEFRHKAFAHSDFTGPLPGHGKMTEVRLVFDGRTVADFSSRPIFEPVLLPHIKALADLLAQKVKESHDNFLNRVLRVIVPQFTEADVGREFELNVEDEKGPMVVRSSEPIAGKYPVVRPMPKIS